MRKFKAEKHIAALNNAKKAMQLTERPFSTEDILRMLKGAGIPSNRSFCKAMKDCGLIQRVGRDKYMFTSKEPIFVDKLANTYAKYKEGNKNTVVAQVLPSFTEEDAIKLLKEKGYEILAPVGVMYVKL